MSVFDIFCFFFIVIEKFYWFVDIGCIVFVFGKVMKCFISILIESEIIFNDYK